MSYGSSGFCNLALGLADFITKNAGGGGPSGCATGTLSIGGVVSGTCAGYSKPSWQSIVGNPSDGVRDLPDVSLFSSGGVWGHKYVVCWSDTANGGQPCTGAPYTWFQSGGTSFDAPIFAGIQALINEKTQQYWGNPDPTYYSLASAEYGTRGNPGCNSSQGNEVNSACIFYDISESETDIPCQGMEINGPFYNCYLPSGYYGVATSDTHNATYAPAYPAATGWDFATGIGTVNVTNLVNAWPTN